MAGLAAPYRADSGRAQEFSRKLCGAWAGQGEIGGTAVRAVRAVPLISVFRVTQLR